VVSFTLLPPYPSVVIGKEAGWSPDSVGCSTAGNRTRAVELVAIPTDLSCSVGLNVERDTRSPDETCDRPVEPRSLPAECCLALRRSVAQRVT
jgi:hypothetical protein